MLTNFFSLREKVAKRGKKHAVLSPYHFCFKLKLLSPPRVEILLKQNLLGTTANFYDIQFFSSLQNGAHLPVFIGTDKADKSCKDFWFFLPFFFQKEKEVYEGFRKRKTPFRVFFLYLIFLHTSSSLLRLPRFQEV